MQKAVSEGRIAVSKVAGEENPADLGTKFVDRRIIESVWLKAGFVLLKGQSRIAYKASITNVEPSKATPLKALEW